nr:amidohydrolase family protein [Gordonia sp. (in: high G+C Gram-positive bacteria)]
KGGPTALTTRTAIELATIGGARVLGRDNEIGSVEPGKLADLVLWDLDTVAHSDIDDPVAALVLGAQPPIRGSWINGRRVVDEARILTVDAATVADKTRAEHRRLLDKAGR